MDMLNSLADSLTHKWTGIYIRVLAVILAYGAIMHVGNILGWTGKPWMDTPLHWRTMDIVLLLFNIVVGVGLWIKAPWAVVVFLIGIIVLQIVPYTLFRSHFAESPDQVKTLNGLVITWVLLLGTLFVLFSLKK